ncbi:MAG: acetyl-CoA carboxylase biotin carboxyl carrier protein subunit, partial [Caldithrix sp.]|nr:acetyl-CoA carboxylase biotin carboxyl carrier protein subunit [Caldithrix sp.]
MKEKEITLDINGTEYTVTIHKFTADEAEVTVNGNKYKVGLKDLGLETAADIKPQPKPAKPEPLHKPSSTEEPGKRSPV